MKQKFILKYLPLFEQDLTAARDYIAFSLHNPIAAQRLVQNTEEAILKRLDNPCSFELYHSTRERKLPYYRINIKNFSVFYVVDGNVMEVRRFVYNKRNLPRII